MSDESPTEPSSSARRKPDWWRYTNASSIGIEMAVAIVLGWWCGRWLETNVTHWKPWTSTIGLLFGCGAAGLAIRRTVREYRAELAAERKDAPSAGTVEREAADIPGADKKAAARDPE